MTLIEDRAAIAGTAGRQVGLEEGVEKGLEKRSARCRIAYHKQMLAVDLTRRHNPAVHRPYG